MVTATHSVIDGSANNCCMYGSLYVISKSNINFFFSSHIRIVRLEIQSKFQWAVAARCLSYVIFLDSAVIDKGTSRTVSVCKWKTIRLHFQWNEDRIRVNFEINTDIMCLPEPSALDRWLKCDKCDNIFTRNRSPYHTRGGWQFMQSECDVWSASSPSPMYRSILLDVSSSCHCQLWWDAIEPVAFRWGDATTMSFILMICNEIF